MTVFNLPNKEFFLSNRYLVWIRLATLWFYRTNTRLRLFEPVFDGRTCWRLHTSVAFDAYVHEIDVLLLLLHSLDAADSVWKFWSYLFSPLLRSTDEASAAWCITPNRWTKLTSNLDSYKTPLCMSSNRSEKIKNHFRESKSAGMVS